MLLATKTLQAIDEAMQKDQGATYRGHLAHLMPLAGDAYSTKEDDWRDHLGASLIGRECSREVWYGFRWATRKRFDGRMLRLFNRGHLEEPRMIALLLTIGCEVWQIDENGKQFRIQGHKGHFGGSLDGVARGIPDLPAGTPVLTEYKTHNDKSFAKLVASGVMGAKWEHFVQMQTYMGKHNLPWSLYMATNKNDDAIHAELVQFDPSQYQRTLDRSVMIIDSVTPPPRISETPGWFKCKFCDHKGVCHGKDLPERTCRSCEYSAIGDNGTWWCENKERRIKLLFPATNPKNEDFSHTPARQRKGCEHYKMIQTFKGQ